MDKLIYTIGIAAVLASLWHPQHVRKTCYDKVYAESLYLASEQERSELNGEMSRINLLEMQKGDHWYKDCLRENGLSD